MGQLREAKAVGRLVIDLKGLMVDAAGGPKDVILSGATISSSPRHQK